MNLINEVNKPEVKKTVVVYSGRFQPFHKGHYASYAKLVSKFGQGNVYIGTSNDQSGPKSPFSFKEKKEIATKMFGIPASRFVQIKNPYQPVEILKKFDGKTTQYIAAVGEKDADRLQGKYFKPYKGKAGYGYDEIGYVYPVPAEQNPISGTDVRGWLGNPDTEKAKKGFLKAYPKFDKDIFKMIKGKLNEWGVGNPAGAAVSVDKFNVIDVDDEKKNEGLPGGIGTGLVLPGGYINGAPTGSNESIAQTEFEKFLQEYFDNKKFINEEGESGGNVGANITNGVLDDQSFRSPWMNDWGYFDNAGQNHAEIVGYTMLGHDSEFHKQKTGDVYLPALNPSEENGPGKRAIHPSKGPEYIKDKTEKWEMYPYNQRPVNIYPPDVDGTMNYARNINESDLYDPIAEILANAITENDFEEWLNEYLGEAPNKALDTDITYTNSKGEQKKIKARDALRLPKDHPAHKQAEKIVGPDDAPANEPKPKAEPGKAAQAAAKPAQPGQPVKKGQTAQGKADTAKPSGAPGAEQGPPPAQKLTGAELKSSAETSPKDAKAEKFKEALDNVRKELSKEENETIDKVNNPESPERKGMMNNIANGLRKVGGSIKKWANHKKEMIGGTVDAVKALANGQKIGSVKNKETGKWEYSDEKRKEQIHHIKHFAKDAALLVGSMALGGAGVAAVKAIGAGHGAAGIGGAALKGATSAFSHGVGGFTAHLGKDIAKHATLETLGLGGVSAAGGGALLSTATGGLLEIINEEVDNNRFISNFIKKVVEKMKTYKLSDEQLLKSIQNYKKNKPKQDAADLLKEEHYVPSTGMFNRNLTLQQKIDKLNPARAIQKSKIWHKKFSHHNPETGEPETEEESLKEMMSDAKKQSIQNFVEYATKRLNLKEIPKITLLSGQEYSNEQSSLGGFNPETKEIFVQTENRLGADILRTIAHEMVHRKQDEMGLIKNPIEAGKDGSPIENQAHAVAGILMREYGRMNKQIYQEGVDRNEKEMIDGIVDMLNQVEDLTNRKQMALDRLKDFKQNNIEVDGISFLKRIGLNEDKKNVHNVNLKLNAVSLKRFQSTPTFSRLLHRDQLKNLKVGDNKLVVNNTVWGALQRLERPGNYQVEKLKEDINVDVDKGDTVLMGKFKNKKVQVKDIGEDPHGMPTINGKQATTFRKIEEMGSKDIHFANMIKLYRDSKFRKRINAYLFANPNGYRANDVARALRNMGYDEITQMEKELNIKVNLEEVSGIAGDDSQPDGGYLPKGHARKLGANDGVNKGDDWYTNGGYTQTDFPVADAIYAADDQNQYTVSYKVKNVSRTGDEMATDFPIRKDKIEILTEGGAYGHMSHPFDDMDLTFGDLKSIITGALNGELGVVREKTDGQALAISWKNGRLIAARNKGHLQNAGANAMGIEDVASKFAGRGGLTDAYNFAMKDLSAAIQSLSEAQRKKIFNEGQCFMNLEVIWPTSVNVIPYGQALLIFHNTTCYDEKGTPTGANQSAAGMLAGMIKQVNADVQSKYTIQGPPVTEIPKNNELSSKQGKYISKLKKLQSEFGLSDSDTLSLYHQSWWENFVDEKAPVKVDKLTKEALVRRWAFGDKSLRLNTITNPKLQEWAIQNDKVNVVKQQKQNIKPFEEIFLGVGADVLEFVSSVLTVHPEKAIRAMKSKLKSVAAQVRSGGDPSKIQKLKTELARLNQLGGIDRIVASEGIVFFYNGKTYKLTGTFAPLNQILGIFYE